MSLAENIIRGKFIQYLDNITPDLCESYIVNNESLFKNTTDENWSEIRHSALLIPGFKSVRLDYNIIIDVLSAERPDLLATICSTTGGISWIKNQIETLHKNMQIS
jgi:hypothetical protein